LEALVSLLPLSIFIEKESRQAGYRLKSIGRLNRETVGHSEIFSKITDEIPFTLASSDKIEPNNFFDRRFYC
jgi:hypothetical protein